MCAHCNSKYRENGKPDYENSCLDIDNCDKYLPSKFQKNDILQHIQKDYCLVKKKK
ncbi:MAG: hypothetical protein IJ509_02690 [Bacilli bacterium]|nr:hypothetical protein [Bacilli bacterium]